MRSCTACQEREAQVENELCQKCLKVVAKGKIFMIGICNETETDPVRNGKVWEIDRSVVEESVSEPMRSIILSLGFSLITEELCQTMGLE